MKRFAWVATILVLFLLTPTWARLGGGQSYSSSRSSSSSPSRSSSSYSSSSSSSSSYSSSSSSYSSGSSNYSSGPSEPLTGIGALFSVLFFLVFFAGAYFILRMVGSVTSGATLRVGNGHSNRDADLSNVPSRPVPSRALARIKATDPNFSEPAFKAFVHLLFSRLHNARGHDFAPLSGYFDQRVLKALEMAVPVSNVVVGASRYLTEASGAKGWEALEMELEATYSGPEIENYTVERWTFARHLGTLSKDPESLLKLGCPNCGNPGTLSAQGVCPFCEQTVNNGAFNWRVVKREVVELVPKPPIQLEPGGAEAGTHLPTVFQADFDSQRRAFGARHPEFRFSDFSERVKAVFMELQAAWSELDFGRARPYETDTLYDTHRFWIERYQKESLKNTLEDIKIEKVEACRCDHDAFYDLITVRIFASMKDYTIDLTGVVVSGSALYPRRFSEYWTFIRRIGAKAGPVKTDISGCPNCGAPLAISQTGVCEHCQAKVTSGEFDWVLSSIEQDESYLV
jgi:Tim44-like domain